MKHHETVIAHRKRQLDKLNELAQMRNRPYVNKFDSGMISELFHRDPADLNDKDGEMIDTLTKRYIERVPA